jgi:hypothetical protein
MSKCIHTDNNERCNREAMFNSLWCEEHTILLFGKNKDGFLKMSNRGNVRRVKLNYKNVVRRNKIDD